MPTESPSFEPQPVAGNGAQDSTICTNCRASMPAGMRFCRNCGYRLGEGSAEYTETVRFNSQAPGARAAGAANAQFGASDWGAMTPGAGLGTQVMNAPVGYGVQKRKRKGPHWIVWVILSVIIASVVSGTFMTPLRIRIGDKTVAGTSQPQSRVGAKGFTSVDSGVMIDSARPVGGPIDLAGILGGDIITSFDGQTIKSESDLRRLISATPVGKTVEVIYLRDGVTATTMLTTVSEDEIDRLTGIADGIPDGFFGIDDLERVQVPNTNIHGVQLGDVTRNRPAYLAGLREGDIVIEMDKIPIRTADELGARIDRSTPDSTVAVVVMRGSERLEIPVKVGIDD